MQGPSTGDASLSATPLCHHVKSLIIKDSKLSTFPDGFLQPMTALEVLNLSGNRGLKNIPGAINSLIHLHYLNLSSTGIAELPQEVTTLHNLEILLVDYTPEYKHFLVGVISSIPLLRVFSKLSDDETYDDTTLLQELEGMKNISDISICIFSDNALQKIIASQKLRSCIRKLYLLSSESIMDGIPSLAPISTLRDMEHLERLFINDCHCLQFLVGDTSSHVERKKRYFCNLRHVCIWNCHVISNLGWLKLAKDRRTLNLLSCSQLKEILHPTAQDNETSDMFPKLTDLTLGNLPILTSISWRVLPFPRLKKINVHDCEKLKQLPFNSDRAKNLKEIKGSRIWWDNLPNDEIKQVLSSKFIPAQSCLI